MKGKVDYVFFCLHICEVICCLCVFIFYNSFTIHFVDKILKQFINEHPLLKKFMK